MAIETQHGTQPVTRSRVDRATASYYPDSKRVIMVADAGDFEAAATALAELRATVECSCFSREVTWCNFHGRERLLGRVLPCACKDRSRTGWYHSLERCYATGLEAM